MQTFPLAADLVVPPKPRPTIETLTSAQAAAEFHSAVEAWGDGLAGQVARTRAWACEAGMKGACDPPS